MEHIPLLDRSGRILEIVPKPEAYDRLRPEFERTADITSFAIPQVALLLFRSAGELILVRRGASWENPHLWDRTAIGHVSAGEDTRVGEHLSETTCFEHMRREAMEELGILLEFSSSKHDFLRKYADGSMDTTSKWYVFTLDTLPWYPALLRGKDGKAYMKRIFKTVYTGVYDGPIVFPDGEAEAVEDIRLENLAAMVAERPFIYTCDMTEYLRRYLPILSDFADTLRSRAR